MKERKTGVLAAGIGVSLLLAFQTAYAVPISKSRTAVNVDWCSAGISGTGGGSGDINLTCVTGTVKKAYLYWNGINDSGFGAVYDNPVVNINGNPVTGTSLGDATTNCWGDGSSRAFEADVTAYVTGNGIYAVTGLSALPEYNSNGASLVVVFDDGNASNNRDLVFFTGNDSNVADAFPGEDDGWHASLPGIDYRGGLVRAQLHVADGQAFGTPPGQGDGALEFSTGSSTVRILDSTTLYDGNSLPTAGTSRALEGELWDIHTFDISSAFLGASAPATLTIDGLGLNNPLPGSEATNDCLALTVMLLDLEPFTAPNEIALEPRESVNCAGDTHTVTATITDNDGVPQAGIDVTFEITSGPNTGDTAVITTDVNGSAEWSYTDTAFTAGTDVIEACFTDADEEKCATADKTWEICNEAPDCTNAAPTLDCLWSPNHKFVDIGIVGVTDPDDDLVTIRITGVTSDEATATVKGAGGITHAPDAVISDDNATAALRAERSGTSDGRVYEIAFTADDGNGGACSGTVQVSVPHDASGKKEGCDAVDSGQTVDATQ